MKSTHVSTQLMSCNEVELHYKRPLFSSMRSITSSQDANEILRDYIHPYVLDVKEFFWTIFLSRANGVLGISTIGSGDISGVMVNVREILQLTLLTNASHLIVAHNHPSGKLVPSERDRKITKKLQQGLLLFDAKLLDHLILTSENFFSFADNGEL